MSSCNRETNNDNFCFYLTINLKLDALRSDISLDLCEKPDKWSRLTIACNFNDARSDARPLSYTDERLRSPPLKINKRIVNSYQ